MTVTLQTYINNTSFVFITIAIKKNKLFLFQINIKCKNYVENSKQTQIILFQYLSSRNNFRLRSGSTIYFQRHFMTQIVKKNTLFRFLKNHDELSNTWLCGIAIHNLRNIMKMSKLVVRLVINEYNLRK